MKALYYYNGEEQKFHFLLNSVNHWMNMGQSQSFRAEYEINGRRWDFCPECLQ